MLEYKIQPFIGVGPVLLGMSRAEVLHAMPEASAPFRKTPVSKHETDSFHRCGFQVFYDGANPTVEFVELSRGACFRARYLGLDVFATPADALVKHITQAVPFDEAQSDLPYGYVFLGLQLSLWRPVVPESDTDIEGRFFSTIGIGRKGYYDIVG